MHISKAFLRLTSAAAFATCLFVGAKAHSLRGGVSVGQNSDGRLEIFTVYNGSIRHNWQLTPGGAWSGWASLGTPGFGACNDPTWCDIGVGRNTDGRLQIFVRDSVNTEIFTKWQLPPGSGSDWSNWRWLGGPSEAAYCSPAVGQNLDGRLEIFVKGPSGDVYNSYQLTPGGDFSGWDTLGDGRNNSPPSVGQNSDGRLQVFDVSNGSAVHSVYQLCPGCVWSNFYSLGSWVNSVPAVGQNSDGRMEIFALDGNHNVIHAWQLVPSGDWSGWDTISDGRANGRPTVALNLDGRLEVFVISISSNILHSSQVCAGCGWSSFTYISDGWVNSWPGVGQNADGRLEIFVYGANDIVYHNWQLTPGGDYSGWWSLDHP